MPAKLLSFLVLLLLSASRGSAQGSPPAIPAAFPDSAILAAAIVPPVLTDGYIDTAAAENLVYGAMAALLLKLPDSTGDYEAALQTWTDAQRSIYLISTLEGEVYNGGFNQYYSNNGSTLAQGLPDALLRIGAPRTAALVKGANACYEANYAQITASQDGTAEGFAKSYENNPLDSFDNAYYKLAETENLSALAGKYIRAHKAEFVVR